MSENLDSDIRLVTRKYNEALANLTQTVRLLDSILMEHGFENLDIAENLAKVCRSLEMNKDYAIEFLGNMNSFIETL